MTATVHQLPLSLENHTKRVRSLMEDWTNNTIELGRELRQTRDEQFPMEGKTKKGYKRPGWNTWLKTVGISHRHAHTLITIAQKFGAQAPPVGAGRKILDIISRATAPEAGAKEVIERIQKGEKVSVRRAKQILDTHRPKPAQANKLAKESGKAVMASDGYLYLGGDQKTIKQATQRRTVVYAVREAIERLSDIELTPRQFLDFALPHQLWNKEEGRQIKRAADWLNDLSEQWRNHKRAE